MALKLLALVTAVAAFAPAVDRAAISTRRHAGDKSMSLPFLERPAKLDGSLVGDVGFDPLMLTDVQPDLMYARTAEIKHGRIAMLAVVGFIVEEFVHLPGAAYQEANPLKAISAVPVAANVQILLVAAVIELATIDKTYGDKPGDLGFDPLSFSVKKTEAQVKDFQLKELKNGRLAMIAFLGMVVQTMLFDKPLLG